MGQMPSWGGWKLMPATGVRYLPMETTSKESAAYFQLTQGEQQSDVFDRNLMGGLPDNNVAGDIKVDTLTVDDIFEWDTFKFPDWEKESLEDVLSWNNVYLVNPRSFQGCKNLKKFTARNAPTITTPSMNFAFEGCDNFDYNLDRWDFSAVTEAYGCFDGCVALSDGNFRKIIRRWRNTRHQNVRSGNNIYVGAEGVTVTTLDTYDEIQAAEKDGVIFTGYVVDIDGVEILTYKNDKEYSTHDYRYRGIPTVVDETQAIALAAQEAREAEQQRREEARAKAEQEKKTKAQELQQKKTAALRSQILKEQLAKRKPVAKRNNFVV
jgi:hypothetical protein